MGAAQNIEVLNRSLLHDKLIFKILSYVFILNNILPYSVIHLLNFVRKCPNQCLLMFTVM